MWAALTDVRQQARGRVSATTREDAVDKEIASQNQPDPAVGEMSASDAGQAATAPPPGRRRRRIVLIFIGALVAAAAGVVAALALSGGPRISMPETLGGRSRIHNGQVELLAKGLSAEVGKGHTQLGVYGTSAQPAFIVIAADSPPPAGGLGTVFAGGFGGLGTTGSVDTTAEVTKDVGSTRYECAPYTISSTSGGGSVNATVCLWDDQKTGGLLMTLDPSLDGMDLVVRAHDAVVG
jgi:hypothetical protein